MNPSEQQLQRILSEQRQVPKDVHKFRCWFLRHFKGPSAKNCKLEDFAIFYLQTFRQCTEQHLRSNEPDTPKCQTPVNVLKLSTHAATSTPNNTNFTPKRLILSNSAPQTPLMPLDVTSNSKNVSQSLTECNSGSSIGNNSTVVSLSNSKMSFSRSLTQSVNSNASTPARATSNHQSHQGSRRSSQCSLHNPSQNAERGLRNTSGNNICLGDFLVANTPTQSHGRSRRKSAPQHGNREGIPSSNCNTGNGSKPKKRVVPTTISKKVSCGSSGTPTAPFGSTTSAFSNDNNLLRLTNNDEIVDRNQCAILKARKSLKLHADEISRELDEKQPLVSQLSKEKSLDVANAACAPAAVDLTQVTQGPVLRLLADIYAQLLDLNLVPNVLTELAYVLQLLNAPDSSTQQSTQTILSDEQLNSQSCHLTLLYDFTNCTYFALHVLQRQCQILIQLDIKSLGVVLNNERIVLLPKQLQSKLERAFQSKQNLLQSQPKSTGTARLDSGFKNVYYQHEKDSRDNFPSANEFAAFKTQRDLFYKIFKLWEANHLNPTFSFHNEMTPKIREIFRQSEHPLTMAHFAKLFVAQLLISASDAATSPQELGVEMDLQKFSKLTQRLVAPSNFSVDYQFPRSQAYFRDFINESGSIAFLVQLKLALYAQLIDFNDSTFEQTQLVVSVKTLQEDETTQQPKNTPFIVRPEVLASMMVLAKFLGYVTALPYNSHNDISIAPLSASQLQLQLRSHFQPDFNSGALLQQAIGSGKLLITLPWLVQYLAMLDSVTLQLSCYVETLHLLFELYTHIESDTQPNLLSTAVFIVRCCIGWLLETKAEITEQYYNYRAAQTTPELADVATIQRTATSIKSLKISVNKGHLLEHMQQLNPTLEQLLIVACPFLPEFRVLIMPAKYATAKCASRTGRYRHITTRYAVLTPPSSSQSPSATETTTSGANNADLLKDNAQQQSKLIDAFLHSQNASMRRLIEFVIERVYKCVVKDAQHEILLPSKANADNQINALTSNKYATVLHAVKKIYATAREEACKAWNAQVPGMIDLRITQSLDTLLPKATNAVIKRTYQQYIKRNTTQQVENWLQLNVIRSNFYCSDLQDMTQKICKANKVTQQVTSSTELCITADGVCVSDLIDDFKYWLHCTSLRPDLMTDPNELEDFVQSISGAFVHTLPTVFYRLVGAGLVQIFQHLISRHTDFLTATMIDAACRIWATPKLLAQTKPIPGELPVPGIFEALITVAFIETLGEEHQKFEKLQQLLIAMIGEGIISVDTLNGLFVPIFKENWAPVIWTEISQLLAIVAAETKNLSSQNHIADGGHSAADAEDDAKSHLFMEVLSDLSRDIDF